ncbi:MAG: hypothetical protein IJ652_04595 [Bacteroidales bacterium]|nr:hypothetical protein [Bacteroidales bacterium]
MKVFLAALIIIGIGVFAMCFNIIFLKKDFPQSDVGANENMRKMGIRCMKEEEMERLSRQKKSKCPGTYSDACAGCGLYKIEH